MAKGTPALAFRCPLTLADRLERYCRDRRQGKTEVILDFLERGLAGELSPPPLPDSTEAKLDRLFREVNVLRERVEWGFQELDATLRALDLPALSASPPAPAPTSEPVSPLPESATHCCVAPPFPSESYATPFDGLALNPGQREAVDSLVQWWQGGETAAALSGAAGTGKTFTVGRLLKELGNLKVAFLAPTHKAKKVLKQALLDAGRVFLWVPAG